MRLCFLFLLFALFPSQAKPQGSSDALLRRARSQFKQNKLTLPYRDNALETLQKLLKDDPENREALALVEQIKTTYLRWAQQAESLDRLDHARLYYRRLLVADPGHGEARKRLKSLTAQALPETSQKASTTVDTSRMSLIPAGKSTMGSAEAHPPDRTPEHAIQIDSYYFDLYEVSLGEFVAFLNEKGNPENAYIRVDRGTAIRQENDRYTVEQGKENHPANFVSWFGADAYCRWKGKRLPTEAEWERAARGNTDRTYAWGHQPPTASFLNLTSERDWKKVLLPVGSFKKGKSWSGAYDMAGSVWEWCSDWYSPVYYKKSPSRNPKGPATGQHRVMRGGQAGRSLLHLESSYRAHNVPGLQGPLTGFRCSLTPPE